MKLNYSCFAAMFLIIFSVTIASTADVTLPKVKIEQGINSKLTDVRQGYWKITGEGQENKKYVGTVYIIKPQGAHIYVLRQQVGAQASDGIGIILDGRLVISWKYTDNTAYGITYVNFNGDKGAAKWTSDHGNGRLVDENWFFLTGIQED